MASQPCALRLLLKLSELVSSMNHRDVQHVQSRGQMNGFPLEIHCAIWGTWEENATNMPPSFRHSERKICTTLPSSPWLLQYNVPFLTSEICIFLSLPLSPQCLRAWRGLGKVVLGCDSVILWAPKGNTQWQCELSTQIKGVPPWKQSGEMLALKKGLREQEDCLVLKEPGPSLGHRISVRLF